MQNDFFTSDRHRPEYLPSGKVCLIHSAPRQHIDRILVEGLKTQSRFDDLGLEMRRNIIYCWLGASDDKMWGTNDEYVHLMLSVDPSRCRVAEMDLASIALMYLQGQGGRHQSAEVFAHLAKAYEAASVTLADYQPGIFTTPEVLVRGNVAPEDITLG